MKWLTIYLVQFQHRNHANNWQEVSLYKNRETANMKAVQMESTDGESYEYRVVERQLNTA